MTELRAELVDILSTVFSELTESGVNFAAREPVYREVHSFASGASSFRRGAHTLANPDEGPLTVMDLYIGQVRDYSGGGAAIVGDARLMTPQTYSKADLLGKNLEEGQELFYRIGTRTIAEDTGLPSGGELYKIENGGVKDSDGLTWQVTLKRTAQ